MTTTHEELKSALWDAANTLRGSAVDRTDWKGYILPLLFFKRICDVWDEETTEAAETFGDVDPTSRRCPRPSRRSRPPSPRRWPPRTVLTEGGWME